MQSTIEHIENLVARAGEVAETKAELLKLRAAGKITETISSLITVIATVILIVASLTIISIGMALWIGSEMGRTYYGFFIVGGFYALVGLLVHLFRKNWIKIPVSNLVIDKLIK